MERTFMQPLTNVERFNYELRANQRKGEINVVK